MIWIDRLAEEARQSDEADRLQYYRDRFHIPRKNGQSVVYFCGNSLGLQPTSCKDYIYQEIVDWAQLGVEGHTKAETPWWRYHEFLTPGLARLVGAKESEVVAMNTLTTNLHLLMASFYRPVAGKAAILAERGSFPSDRYALVSQIRFHGFDPEVELIEVGPRDGESCIEDSEIIEAIEKYADRLALVLIGGVQYYTGQRFDMKSITTACRQKDIPVGLDLAHAIGNVELALHEWGTDFAVWCSYKYLNGGPGAVGGAFVHERHHHRDLRRLTGWWGHDKTTRFSMPPDFVPMQGAEAWQLSNEPVFAMAALLSSLEVFGSVELSDLFEKRDALTAFTERCITECAEHAGVPVTIITPAELGRRGAQLSCSFAQHGRQVFEALIEAGVIVDWREPNVIRIAPAPLYNSFGDAVKLARAIVECWNSIKSN